MNLLTHLGIKTEQVTAEKVILSLQVNETHQQPYGVMHGGVSAVLIETACSIGGNANLQHAHAVGIDLSVNHLKSIATGTVIVVATPDRIGRTIQVWQATLYNDQQEKLAVGRCTLAVVTH